MSNNFLKKVGQGFLNIPHSALYGVSILITSVAFLTTSLKMNTNYNLLEEIKKGVNDKELLNKINERFKVIQSENNDFKNKVIDKLGMIDLIKEKLMKECSEIKVLITNLQNKAINLNTDVKNSLESLDSKFNKTKDEIKKEVEDYQKYVLKQLQTSDEKDDNRNNTIMQNHNLVIEEIKAILSNGEAADLELKKIQTLLIKSKGKLERIEDITAVNNIEIVKNGVLMKQVNDNINELSQLVKDRLIWISRYLSTLTDNSKSLIDKTSWINRNLHTLAESNVKNSENLESLESDFDGVKKDISKIKENVSELIESSDQDYQLYQDLVTNLTSNNMMLNNDITTKLRMLEAKLLAQYQQHSKVTVNSLKKEAEKLKKEINKITRMRREDLSDLSELQESIKILKEVTDEYKNQDLNMYLILLGELTDKLTPVTPKA